MPGIGRGNGVPTFSLRATANGREVGDADGGTRTLSATLGLPLGGDTSFSARGQLSSSEALAGGDGREKTFSLGASRRLAWNGWQGTVAPGFSWRDQSGPGGDGRTSTPTLDLGLRHGSHSIRGSARYALVRNLDVEDADNGVLFNSLTYTFVAGPHRVEARAEQELRRPDAAPDNDGYHLGLRYVFAFDRAKSAANAYRPPTAPPAATGRTGFTMAALQPGNGEDQILAYLRGAGFPAGRAMPQHTSFDLPIYPSLAAPQRLVLEWNEDRTLRRAAVLVETHDPFADAAALRRSLIAELGRPDRVVQTGGPTPLGGSALVAGLRSGAVVDQSEWRTPRGTVRAGLALRPDGRVQVEVQHAAFFPHPTEPAWVLDRIF